MCVSMPTNCDGVLFQNYSVGFTCMKCSAIFYKAHYSSQKSLERNPLKGHMTGRGCSGWEQKARVFPSPPLTGHVHDRITWFLTPSLSLTPPPNCRVQENIHSHQPQGMTGKIPRSCLSIVEMEAATGMS